MTSAKPSEAPMHQVQEMVASLSLKSHTDSETSYEEHNDQDQEVFFDAPDEEANKVFVGDAQSCASGSETPSSDSEGREEDTIEKLAPTVSQLYKPEKVLYEGANGVVALATHKHTNAKTVVKIMKMWHGSGISPDYYTKQVKREFDIVTRLKNSHVIPIIELCKNDIAVKSGSDSPFELKDASNELSFIVPFYPQGDLLDYLSFLRKKKVTINSNLKDSIFKQILQGVKYLHANNIVHRDLKPENLLIGDDGVIKISDFTYSVDLTDLDHFWDPYSPLLLCGTNSFKAPEIFEAEKELKEEKDIEKVKNMVDLKALDYWSLGIMYIQIAAMKKPWTTAQTTDSKYKSYKSNYPTSEKLLDSLNKDIEDNVLKPTMNSPLQVFKELHYHARLCTLKMLNPNNSKRMDIDALLASDWLLQCYAKPNEIITLKQSVL